MRFRAIPDHRRGAVRNIAIIKEIGSQLPGTANNPVSFVKLAPLNLAVFKPNHTAIATPTNRQQERGE
ncbi:MAG: hypothetical protein A2X82_08150 [Geobacteraceae bacterium GWC2_55_20]|nr:MAG: hypothetical protein A2X82_08150 [Geobacteraceae bacterium GWC2_55_20]OGU18538.1 MAG: hypothetical protein A2X85_00250 [Geobacteraceae bacterium GWF2_54_21]HCE69314.1 hypothetical protein [Geobacter sp.]